MHILCICVPLTVQHIPNDYRIRGVEEGSGLLQTALRDVLGGSLRLEGKLLLQCCYRRILLLLIVLLLLLLLLLLVVVSLSHDVLGAPGGGGSLRRFFVSLVSLFVVVLWFA